MEMRNKGVSLVQIQSPLRSSSSRDSSASRPAGLRREVGALFLPSRRWQPGEGSREARGMGRTGQGMMGRWCRRHGQRRVSLELAHRSTQGPFRRSLDPPQYKPPLHPPTPSLSPALITLACRSHLYCPAHLVDRIYSVSHHVVQQRELRPALAAHPHRRPPPLRLCLRGIIVLRLWISFPRFASADPRVRHPTPHRAYHPGHLPYPLLLPQPVSQVSDRGDLPLPQGHGAASVRRCAPSALSAVTSAQPYFQTTKSLSLRSLLLGTAAVPVLLGRRETAMPRPQYPRSVTSRTVRRASSVVCRSGGTWQG